MFKTLATLSFLGGATLGAGLMFYLDPDRGERRRTKLKRQTVRAGRRAGSLTADTARDVADRTRLLVREAANGRHFKRVLAPRTVVRTRLAANGRAGKVALATLAATVAAAGGAVAYRQIQ